jgi:predicted glycosyltransferase
MSFESIRASIGHTPPLGPKAASGPRSKGRIWIDLDNTPHVPFFKPIIAELEARGYVTLVTARDAFQVKDLAERSGLKFTLVGQHYGRNSFMKVFGYFYRTLQLIPSALRFRPSIALSHGSRSQILASNLLRIPTVAIMDYEYTVAPPLGKPRWEIVPEVVETKNAHSRDKGRVLKYRGIKEDVYAGTLALDPGILKELRLESARLVITVRPPATEAHYHRPESERLLERFMIRALSMEGAMVVLLPRNGRQADLLAHDHPEWFRLGKVVIPGHAVDGMNLIWHSDLVVSGGGTMNREAAALGIPVYSIFRGPTGAVDIHLAHQKRLTLIETVEDVDQKILIQPRGPKAISAKVPRYALSDILHHLDEIMHHYATPPETTYHR